MLDLQRVPRMHPVLTWTDRPGSSVRSDGAKCGSWNIEGRTQWFAYPAKWKPRCELTALGPFETIEQAKYAIDTWLNLEIA